MNPTRPHTRKIKRGHIRPKTVQTVTHAGENPRFGGPKNKQCWGFYGMRYGQLGGKESGWKSDWNDDGGAAGKEAVDRCLEWRVSYVNTAANNLHRVTPAKTTTSRQRGQDQTLLVCKEELLGCTAVVVFFRRLRTAQQQRPLTICAWLQGLISRPAGSTTTLPRIGSCWPGAK